MNNETDLTNTVMEERTDILFREIELAVRWERPAILFAIYRSDEVRDQVMVDLEHRLSAIGQKVRHMALAADAQLEMIHDPENLPELAQTTLFLDGLQHKNNQVVNTDFEQINKYREYFIDNSLRAVFWLFEQDVPKFAARATECWYLRHRVIDFTDEVKPSQLFLNTLESCMQVQAGEMPQGQDPDKLQQDVEALSEELNLQPSHGTVLYILGLLWERKNDHEHAGKFFNAALEIARTTKDAKLQGRCLESMAVVQTRMGNTAQALELYRQALPLHAKPGPIWKSIGLLLSVTPDHQQTIEAFLNCLRSSPQDTAAWLHLGSAYLNMALYDKAWAAYESALELIPDSDEAWLGLAKSHVGLNENDQAVLAFQKAAQANPQNTAAWLGLGRGFLQQKRETDALLAFQKVSAAEPNNVEALVHLGSLYIQQKKYDRAQVILEKALQLEPGSGEASQNLGIAEFQTGNYEHAAFLFEQAIPLFGDLDTRAMLWKYLGDTCIKLGREQMAVLAFKQAAQLVQPDQVPVVEPSLPEAPESTNPPQQSDTGGKIMMESKHIFDNRSAKEWSDLGNAFLKAGAYKKAVFAFTKAIEMAPENSWPYIKNLAVANYQMGKHLGKRQVDQPEDPDLWEIDEEEEIPFSAAINLPESQRGEPPADDPEPDADFGQEAEPSPAGPPPQPHAEAQEPELETQESEAELPESELESEEPTTAEDLQETEPLAAQPPASNPVTQPLPPSAEDLNEWGNNYASMGDFDKAIEAYKRSIQTDPSYGQPYSNLGFIYFKKGDFRLATLLFQKGIELLPAVEDQAATLNRLGDAFHRLHRYEDAFLAYKRARELAPSKNPILDRARISILQNSIG